MKGKWPRARWRFILHREAPGAWNMAVDEAIARMAGAGEVPPTLRVYAWSPPCISLGRHQPLADIDLERARADGIDIVRRPTGGRAILHADEITYSVAGPPHEPRLQGMVLDVYQRLSDGLILALEQLGVHVYKAEASARAGPDAGPICFQVPSAYEIVTLDGRKIVGSAQVRKRDWILQHGAIPLRGDVTRLAEYLALPEEKRRELKTALAARAVSVEGYTGRPVSFQEAAEALREGFARALHLDLEPGELTDAEYELARTLAETVYAHPEWTTRV